MSLLFFSRSLFQKTMFKRSLLRKARRTLSIATRFSSPPARLHADLPPPPQSTPAQVAAAIANMIARTAKEGGGADVVSAWRPQDVVEQDAVRSLELFASAIQGEWKHIRPDLLRDVPGLVDPSDATEALIATGVYSKNQLQALRPRTIPLWHTIEELDASEALIQEIDKQEADLQNGSASLSTTRKEIAGMALAIDNVLEAQDVDDAISLLPDGWIQVHIADVSEQVIPSSFLSRTGSTRCQSTFLPDQTSPMLPSKLETKLSLRNGRGNNAMTFAAKLDEEGNIVDFDVFESRCTNVQHITYDQATDVLKYKGEDEISKMLSALRLLSDRLVKRRQNAGAKLIEVEVRTLRVTKDEAKKLRVMIAAESANTDSRAMVANMMILAGEVAALYSTRHNIPVLHREHSGIAISLDGLSSSSSLTPPHRSLVQVLNMPAGGYSVTPKPHLLLGLSAYVQCTSPIRRFPDLFVVQQFKAHLRGQSLPFNNDEAEYVARRASWLQQLMKRQVRASQRSLGLQFLKDEMTLSTPPASSKSNNTLNNSNNNNVDSIIRTIQTKKASDEDCICEGTVLMVYREPFSGSYISSIALSAVPLIEKVRSASPRSVGSKVKLRIDGEKIMFA